MQTRSYPADGIIEQVGTPLASMTTPKFVRGKVIGSPSMKRSAECGMDMCCGWRVKYLAKTTGPAGRGDLWLRRGLAVWKGFPRNF